MAAVFAAMAAAAAATAAALLVVLDGNATPELSTDAEGTEAKFAAFLFITPRCNCCCGASVSAVAFSPHIGRHSYKFGA